MLAQTLLTVTLALCSGDTADDALLTVAESSGYQATSTHEEVMDLVERLDARSPLLTVRAMGETNEGRVMPLMIIADPPVATAEEAIASGKLILFALGNIHAGEVCGKEALLMLARELTGGETHPLLEHLVIVFAPIYNADGNDRMSTENRPGQVGPARGMGQRPNAQGLDLNRDFVKLESPEARALVRFLDAWDPHLSVDTHTTNGTYHRYTLTYDYPLNPAGHPEVREYLRDTMLPVVTERLLARTGYDTFFYGNLNRRQMVWATYSAQPRFGANYQALRGQMSILSEAYAYATYEDRVLCTREFVREIMEYAAEHAEEMRAIHDRVREETTAAGANPQPTDVVGLRHAYAAHPTPAVIKSFEFEGEGRRARPTETHKDYTVVHLGRFENTLSVARPLGYLLPGGTGLDGVRDKLAQHGVEMEPFSGEAEVERYAITEITRAPRAFQGHKIVRAEAEAERATETFAEGAWLVRTAQPLGNLVVYLLEPESEDGLVAWNFFDEWLEERAVFPVRRVLALP